ncbi:MAG TPA: 30S ribosomal protein S6 [Ktedonobacterales bacterium]|nr:30S ribosomal protein S6 [Ktedonobacterales bacterium]
MARDYELGIIINPDAGDEQARAIVERVTHTVGTQGGQVVRVDAWGRRHLAYSIERHRDGLIFWFDLIMPPTAVTEVERSLRVNESVLRYLITLRDPRVVGQKRQREAEMDQQAAVRAAEQAARAEQAALAAQAQAAQGATEPAGAPAATAEADGAATEASATAAIDVTEAPTEAQATEMSTEAQATTPAAPDATETDAAPDSTADEALPIPGDVKADA